MTDRLRLVSYNLLEGLRPVTRAADERRDLDRKRAEAAHAVVSDLRPDILVLNEALFCRQHLGRTVDYAGLFGFHYQAAALYDGWGNGRCSGILHGEHLTMRAWKALAFPATSTSGSRLFPTSAR